MTFSYKMNDSDGPSPSEAPETVLITCHKSGAQRQPVPGRLSVLPEAGPEYGADKAPSWGLTHQPCTAAVLGKCCLL